MIVHQSLIKTMAVEAWSFFGAWTLPRKTFVGSVATFFSPLSPAVLPVAVTQSHQSRFKAIQACSSLFKHFGTPSRGGLCGSHSQGTRPQNGGRPQGPFCQPMPAIASLCQPMPAYASLCQPMPAYPPPPCFFDGGRQFLMVAICGLARLVAVTRLVAVF